ncbi:MAG TPA: transglutaminaseTgpA domain-containing protein [Gaiellales bacterium]|nr:transglutaminaseTgpA domain-containing protein [Gaiellales bacterium]
MAERIWVLVAVALFSGWHWQQLERPTPSPGELALLAVLAAVPAIIAGLGRRRLAIIAAVVTTLIAIWRAFAYLPWDRGHQVYPVRIVSGLHDGAKNWFDTSTPFDPSRFATTSGLVDLCFFALMAVFAWLLIDGRFALAALACAFALYAIPSTAVGMGSAGLRAAIFLLLALAILAVCQRRVPLGGGAIGQLSVLAVATVVAGLVVGSAPGVAKGALFDWRHWNPLAGNGPQVSVGYVWNQDYGPLHWPKQTTTVFQVQSAHPHYWKAGVLTVFDGAHWVSSPATQASYHATDAIGVPTSEETSKELHPDSPTDITQVGFTVEALADFRLLSTGQPLRYTLTSPIDASLTTDGSVIAAGNLPRGATYTVRAYSPNPKPKQLAEVGNAFPPSVAQSVVVNHAAIPVWGSTTKKRTLVPIDGRLIAASDQAWHASGADEPGTSEYGAVVALESYFHGKQFHYDQTPPVGPGPVLAYFMLHSHRGYCQMYSGSMALVLRLHGIPARVAYGFTEGSQTQTGYKVTDRDAHAWVEAYFPKYGWIPFEPTPTRNLPEVQASTTNAAWAKSVGDQKNAGQFGIQSQQLRKRLTVGPNGLPATSLHGHGHGSGGGGTPDVRAARSGGHSFFLWAISAATILIAVLAAVKLVAVRWRYLRRGPRGQASAAYHELATYIGDQGVRVNANATFEELAGLVEHTWGVDASPLARAGSAARYAPPPIADRAGHEVRPALRRIRRDLRKSIDLRDRAMGSLRLRSMLAQTTHLD